MSTKSHSSKSRASGFLGLEALHQPIASPANFFWRIARSAMLAGVIVFVSLVLGACGYHYLEDGIPWLDAFLNAAMILTGMGPVATLQTVAGKVFAIFYSLYSGIVFLTVVGLVLIPLLHRILHTLHLPVGDDDELAPPSDQR